MIWLGPTTVREIVAHEQNTACRNHCTSCDVDHLYTNAWEWCGGCRHGFQTVDDLIAEHRFAVWRESKLAWLRSYLTPKYKLAAKISHCPLCGHNLLESELSA